LIMRDNHIVQVPIASGLKKRLISFFE